MTRGGAAGCAAVAVVAAAAIGGARGDADSAEARPTVVAVEAVRGAAATGFTVAPERVVTVAHALEGAAAAVRGPDGVTRRGTVLRSDRELDLALLEVPGLRAAPVPPAAGTRVLVRRAGGITALPASVTRRIDASVRQAGTSQVARRPALELAARTGAGDSGAPVLVDGRVAGVVFAASSRRVDIAYAVDARVLDRLVR